MTENQFDKMAADFLDSVGGTDEELKWHFRTFYDVQKGMPGYDPDRAGETKAYHSTYDKCKTFLHNANNDATKHGVFVVINGGGTKDAQIDDIRAVWLDMDIKDFKDYGDYEQAVKFAYEGRYSNHDPEVPEWPKPSVVVQSGNGQHIYWLLDGGECEPKNFKRVQQALAKKFKGDQAVCNPARIMRLPGTKHWKTGAARTVKTVQDIGGFYNLDDLLRGLDVSLEEVVEAPNQPATAFKLNSRPETPETVKDLRSALSRISADCSRDEWFKVLTAVKAHGFSVGMEMAREWSQSAPDRYIAEHFERDWQSLKTDGGVSPATLYWMAGADPDRCPDTDTDDGKACRFNVWAGGQVMYSNEGWYWWTGAYWKPDTAKVEAELMRFAKELVVDTGKALGEATASGDKGSIAVATANFKAAKRMQYAQTRKGVMDSLRVMTTVSKDKLNVELMELCTPSGVVDLKTGRLLPPVPEQRHTLCTGVPYEADAQCPLWLEFLGSTFNRNKDIIAYVKRWFGYMLTGSVAEEAMLFGYGSGANGKSVLANLLAHIMGTYCGQVNNKLLTVNRSQSSSQASPELARLEGLRVALLNETAAGERWDDAKIKSLVSKERIVARNLHSEERSFTPTAKLFVRGNNKPSISDTSDGLWRRLHLLDFPNRLTVKERDMKLEEKLKAEGAGILAWAVQGCLEWQEQGLAAPDRVMEAVKEYRGSEDLVQEWIGDHLESGGRTLRTDLYNAFKRFAKGIKPISAQVFYESLSNNGFKELKSMGARYFQCRLREESPTGFVQD